jgi:hypothetical protein
MTSSRRRHVRTAAVGLLVLATTHAACSRDNVPAASVAPASAATTAPAPPAIPPRSTSRNIEVADLFYLRSAGDPRLSPDGTRVLFTVQYSDRTGPPYTRIWIGDLTAGSAKPWGSGEGQEGSAPRWAPDGKRVAFEGRTGEGKSGIVIANDATGGCFNDNRRLPCSWPISRANRRGRSPMAPRQRERRALRRPGVPLRRVARLPAPEGGRRRSRLHVGRDGGAARHGLHQPE